jgi:hypothetical protein
MSLQRFPIHFDRWYAIFSSIVFVPPSRSFIEVHEKEVRVQMSWAFRSRFPKTAVTFTTKADKKPMSRGVHGFAGRWLVNGSGEGILVLHLSPAQRGYVMGFPVRLRELMISVADPDALAAALRRRA